MENFSSILSIIKNITFRNIIDILIVAYILYKVFMLIRETRAEQLIKGLILILVVTKLSHALGLVTLYWIIKNTITVGVIALVIIFQPELRKALEHLGRSKILTKKIFESEEEIENLVGEIATAAGDLSSTKTGALIIIEQETGLNDIVQSGIKIDAATSSALLENIFVENTPLHDGAAIIRKNRIIAAACVLPLTEQNVSNELGTRHRASIGITENSDAIAVVVSEETGTISLALNGRLTRNYTPERLKNVLIRLLNRNMNADTNMFKKVKTWLTKTKNK
ncbi:MAG TPA: TIGR00159 family protein [Clostridiaceae bacterium]|jgi:diadenylate cyclase|nr:TIGR00159 family protein [Clostridiaceae bacterium]HBG39475.1 TIGR00159 family protein [Clostridiaceae bacterium]HBN28184.1 TIGR00159 family protein [Clostridiaceae bacterium]HBX47900.1 TIGR00159 family protein [Clostridiaceae bacterium]HCL50532.1 TIGR00159 family protein [Clostridiaceae bacterium]